MKKHHQREKMLSEMPVGPLLVRMSVPAIIGMFVNALYNLVDRAYLGHLPGDAGRNAIGGLTVAFPVQTIALACALFLGIGAASVVSRSLGRRDYEKVQITAGNVFFISIVTGTILALGGSLFADPVINILGSTELLKPFAKQYLGIIFIGFLFTMPTITMNNLIRAEGKANMAMVTMLSGAVMNMILDPVFIYGFGMGIRGAAIATVISQLLSFSWVMLYFFSGKSLIRIKPSNFKPTGIITKEVLPLGFGAFIRQISAAVLIIVINFSMKKYGDVLGSDGSSTAISAFGLVNSLMIFVLMPILGIGQGMQPVAGYNYGAGKNDRVRTAVRMASLVSVIIGSLYFILMFLFPGIFIGIFSGDSLIIEFGSRFLKTVVLLFPVIGLQIIGSVFFLAIGKVIPSLILSMLRQVILLIPAVLILPRFFGLDGVLTAFPVSDGLATVITVIWMYLGMKKEKILDQNPLKEPALNE